MKLLKIMLISCLLIVGFIPTKEISVKAIDPNTPIYYPHIEYDMNLKKNTSSSFNRKEASGDLEINYKEEYENLYFDFYEPDTNYTYFYENDSMVRYLVYTGCDDPNTSNNSNLHFKMISYGNATYYKTMEIYQFKPDDEYYIYTLSEVSSITVDRIYKGYFNYKIDKEKYEKDEYLYFMFAFINTKNQIDTYEVFKMKNPYYGYNEITNVSIEQYNPKVYVGETLQLSAKVTPNYTNKDKTIIWETSDENIATIDENGLVKGISYGDVTITARTLNGRTSTVDLKVRVKPESISVVPNLVVDNKKAVELKVEVYPIEAAKDLQLELKYDADIISVSSYVDTSYRIDARDGGKTTLTFTTPNGLSASCEVKTIYPLEDVNSAYVLEKLVPNKTVQLNYYTTPKHPTDNAVITWEIADESIASVSGDAYVTGIKKGKTELIAKINGVEVSRFGVKVLDDPLRVYGNTRYETSYRVAELMKEIMKVEKFETVVLTTGQSYPDALSGSYLAVKNNAPLILTTESRYDELVNFLDKNLVEGGKVYILGGENALPTTLESKLEGYEVERLSGANRYETNMLVLNEANVNGEDILVCTGQNYADSLSASGTGKPILLVNTVSNQLYDYQKEFLNEYVTDNIYVIGGYSAVGREIENEVQQYGYVSRYSGSDRIQTSAYVANFFNPYNEIVLVYSHNFPDGLSGGPLAYLLNAPIILMNDKSNYKEYISSDLLHSTILGGPTLISDDTVLTVMREKKLIKVVDYK